MPNARFVYIRLISDAQIKIVIRPNKYKVKSNEDTQFQKNVLDKSKVIFSWDQKILSISKNKIFVTGNL